MCTGRQVVDWVAPALVLLAASTARAQTPAVEISTAADVLLEHPEFHPNGGEHELDPDSKAAVLGAAFDVIEKWLRLPRDEAFKSPAITERSRGFLPTAPERQKIEALRDLREEGWRDQFVDARFAGDRVATMILLLKPRAGDAERRVVTLDMVRQFDAWQVTFDLPGDAALPLGDEAPAHLAALRAAVDRRVAEIASVVSAPLKERLPFSGTWTTHFRQTFVYVTFHDDGHAFFLRTEGGASGYGIYDYHLTDDEIVLEMPFFPVRIKRRADLSPREHLGRQYPDLLIEDPRFWFPECREPLGMRAVLPDDAPVSRPAASAEPAAE
jgi:hypothetical protein